MRELRMTLGSWRFRKLRFPAFAFTAVVGVVVGLTQIGQALEHQLREAAAAIRERDASGSLHIVEIDARSIAAVDRWPWPRRNYAALVDRLRAAGAASIAFDVDFSARSQPRDDAAFAAALARANGQVVLPTFGQYAGSGDRNWTDSLPILALREQAALATVSIRPDPDGYVRRAPMGTVTDRVPRPSLSAMIAGVSGTADTDFLIDFAIDPESIPRHSFIDIRDGRFDPRQIAGKKILIGATAIELGDRYAVPNRGVIPGVVLQALAAETLARGVPRELGWWLPLLAALTCAWPILRLRHRAVLAAAVLTTPLLLFAASVAAQEWAGVVLTIVPALAVLVSASAVAATRLALAAAQERRSRDFETGLPNRLALRLAPREAVPGIVTARFAEFDKLSASLGEQAIGDLVRRVHDRIVLIAEGATIYRVEDRVLAWVWADPASLDERLGTLRTMMLNPLEVAGRRLDVKLALGFAAREATDDVDKVLAHATLAAAQSLATSQAWHVYDPREKEAAEVELSLLGELDEAVANGAIEVFYQPKLSLASDAIVSVEALVRWKHATRGYLRPDLFIPLAERNDRIAGLTLHVLRQTMDDLARWRALGLDLTAAVNISAKALNSPPFLVALQDVVARGPVPPSALTFEVTESAAMTDVDAAAAALQSFRAIGIGISMDDYGTGQSTLSYLQRLPLNELKIDRRFVQFAHENRGDGVLVQSTINLAHELGLTVVAEGVEDAECLAFLRDAQCDLVQGYLVAKPMNADDLLAFLADSKAAAA